MELISKIIFIGVVVFFVSVFFALAIAPLLAKNAARYPKAYPVYCSWCRDKNQETIVSYTTVPNSHGICAECKLELAQESIKWPRGGMNHVS